MLKNKSGDLLGVFHRDDVGDIDLVWGDRKKNSGLDHIIEKHIERLKDFSSAEEAIQVIEDVINNGQIDEKKSKWDKITIKYGDFTVVLRKNVRDENGNIIDSNKNWVVTAFDATISPKRKEVNSSDVTRVTLNTNKGGRAVTSDERTSDSKDSELSQKSKEDAEENKKPRLEKADSKATEVSSTDALLRDALVRILRKMGIKVITDNKKAQRVLDRENGRVLSKGLMLANADTEKSDSTLSAIDNNANPTSWGTSDSIAKVDNRIEITKESINKINGLSKRINKEGRLSPEEFLLSIEKALGSNNDNVDKTQYFKGDNDRTLRLANHRCNCRMFLLHDHTTKNTSIVVKLSEKAFKGNKNVDAIEYVYFPDKLTKEVQLNILEGIKEWIDNGEYDKKCDQINISTIQNGIRKHVVRHGELEDAEIESLIAYIQEKIETIENETTDGIYNLLRKMAELNYNAYKGRGSSRFGFTTKIYKVKNVAVPKIANELLSRGEYVGFDREQRIIYFKDNNEHQISFHGFYEPNFSEELRDKVEYEAKWDGIKEFWRKEEDYRILRERQKQREKIQAEIDILTQHFYKENAVLTEQKYPWDLDYSSVIRDMAITGWSSQSYAKDAFNAFIAKSDEAKRLLEEQKKLKAQENAIPYSEIQNKLYSLEAKLKRLRKPESIEKTTKDIIELQKQKKETWKEILLLRDKIKGIGEEMVLLYHKLREQKRPEVERVNREMEVKREDYKNKIEILKNQELPKLNALRFFRTANGEAYGFTVDGKIYLDPTIAGAETAIHEYTHLWATALKNANPKEWSNIVSLLKGTPIWDKVASEYPELTTDDELADEVLAHYSGKRGAERLRKEAESIANGKGSLLDKAGAISALERVKEALTRFWKATTDLLHIHFTTAEEVADKVLADLLNGVNPNEVAKEYRRKQKQLEMINETNPMLDNYHVGIRGLSDILTMREAIEEARQEAEEGDYETLSAYPDITNEMLENALQSGKITVYSSKPIKDGNFVTPSRMQAEDYAGDGMVYSKTVSIDDVAWINTDEGQFVKNSKDKAEKAPLRFQLIEEQGAEESRIISPLEMSESEKSKRRELLQNTPALNVASGQIVKTQNLSARKSAEIWWERNITSPLHYQTEIGDVVININSIGDSLAHGYSQAKLDAITSLKHSFRNAVYLGSLRDFTRNGNVLNHYFAYPILYNGNRCYVFCRAMHDANKNQLYVHEVFVADKIEKGNTLQTAASKPHGGIALYKDTVLTCFHPHFHYKRSYGK